MSNWWLQQPILLRIFVYVLVGFAIGRFLGDLLGA